MIWETVGGSEQVSGLGYPKPAKRGEGIKQVNLFTTFFSLSQRKELYAN
jgi:hypothetical protein